ncbi:MAG: hypothetical protein HWN67_19595 [Candidatus Helarchaeota archaeon]|nr:hypothetical protein [Candidatus Helarchaeota archaeon]
MTEESEEKKDILSSLWDGLNKVVNRISEANKKFWDKLLGKEEGEGIEGEEAKGGLAGIIERIAEAHKNYWDILLRRKEGEEPEKGRFDPAKIIRDIRNRIRDFLGIEPLPEEETSK